MPFDKRKSYYGGKVGDYRIIGRIGEGRYGVCFLAEKDGEKVILKKVKPDIFNRNKEKNSYEARILSELLHPGIPRLLGVVDVKGFYGLALEPKYGDTIEAMLFKQRHSFSDQEIHIVGAQLIAIIKYLHERGIVHRDIRIPNVLIHGDTISLVDFGLARRLDHNRYTRDIDFSYFGDLLLYLLYSSYKKEKQKLRPWYVELSLTDAQRVFLKRLLILEEPFRNIDEIAEDFLVAFRFNEDIQEPDTLKK